jgi:hypothetical protein
MKQLYEFTIWYIAAMNVEPLGWVLIIWLGIGMPICTIFFGWMYFLVTMIVIGMLGTSALLWHFGVDTIYNWQQYRDRKKARS